MEADWNMEGDQTATNQQCTRPKRDPLPTDDHPGPKRIHHSDATISPLPTDDHSTPGFQPITMGPGFLPNEYLPEYYLQVGIYYIQYANHLRGVIPPPPPPNLQPHHGPPFQPPGIVPGYVPNYQQPHHPMLFQGAVSNFHAAPAHPLPPIQLPGIAPGFMPNNQQPPHHSDAATFSLSASKVSVSQPIPNVVRSNVTTMETHIEGGVQFDKYIKAIWSFLMDDDDVFRIGIHGIGGVGKTEVAKHIHNKLLQNPSNFHQIIWVELSPALGIRDLQSLISKAMGLDLSDGDDQMQRAAKLSKALAEMKKSLLILDNVWDYIPLQDVGVTVGVDQCTVLITTRSLEVCRNFHCQRKIEIRCLQPDECYELFIKNLGNETTFLREVEQISKLALAADKCVGLPLAISVMSKNMKGVTDMGHWTSALVRDIVKKADKEIFQTLRVSYDYLKDEALQHCFLYCSSFVVEHRKRFVEHSLHKRVLAEHLVNEGIAKCMNSRREELVEAHRMLNVLIDAGLLEIEMNLLVKMNEVIRRMALQIMEKNNQRAMTKNNASLKDFPDEQSWTGDLVRASLKGNEIEMIASNNSRVCPKFSTLLLSDNHKLRYIENSFFEGMPGLKVLDLSHTAIESLPSSLYDLVNLTALLLSSCRKLRKILSVEKLKALKKLDLSFSAVEEVPENIELLEELTYLDLFHSRVKLEPRILEQLSGLQFLRLPFSSAANGEGEALGCLKRLETLNCCFYNVEELNKYLIHLKEGFKEREAPIQLEVNVGPGPIYCCGFATDYFNDAEDMEDDEKFKDLSSVTLDRCDINKADMLIYFQQIVIVKCNLARSLCNLYPIKGATELKYFSIQDCGGLEFLCSSSYLTGQGVLENIEYMELFRLEKLSVLLKKERDVAYGSCFSNLTRFVIQGCPSIKRLFPFHLLPNLKNLQRLYVIDCLSVEVIFEPEEKETSMAAEKENRLCLPRLRIFLLKDLPELKTVCGGRKTFGFTGKYSMKSRNCPKLRRWW